MGLTLEFFRMIERANHKRELIMSGEDETSSYRRLAMMVHPDKVEAHLRDRATEVFQRLDELFNGKKKSSTPVKIGKYVVVGEFASGDIADLYKVETEKDGETAEFVLKISRSQCDNDLLERESSSLKAVYGEGKPSKFAFYAPKLVETFNASGRRVNILTSRSQEELYYTLDEIKSMHPDGLDFRHVVWMMNRVLSLLGYAARKGVVHGAVVPSHLLYSPRSHHMMLVDWCYSCQKSQVIPAMAGNYPDLYPPEVARQMTPSPATDIYMAAASLRGAAGAIPPQFRSILDWCLVKSPSSRPSDAWDLQDRWMAAAKQVYGPPKFVELTM